MVVVVVVAVVVVVSGRSSGSSSSSSGSGSRRMGLSSGTTLRLFGQRVPIVDLPGPATSENPLGRSYELRPQLLRIPLQN